jgi:hypothetical protein
MAQMYFVYKNFNTNLMYAYYTYVILCLIDMFLYVLNMNYI